MASAHLIESGYERHPLSAICGDMPDAQLKELASDINANGQKDAVVLYEGKVLDGWHRYSACVMNGQAARAVEYQGTDPAGYVASKNLHRRSLTASQRAAIIVRLREWAPAHRPPEKKGAPGAPLMPPATNDQLAGEAGVSKRTIQQAKKAEEAGLGDAVANGEVSAKRAAEEADAKTGGAQPVKKPSKVEKLQARLQDAQSRIAELETSVDELVDELKTLSAVELGEEGKELQVARATIRTLESQCREYQNEAAQWKREALGLRRRLG